MDWKRLIPASQHGISEDLGPQEGKAIVARRFEVYAPYTPNVVKNLKDKPQPVRDDRHYVPGVTGGLITLTCPKCGVWGDSLCRFHGLPPR